ncbi:DgsA anti-repressor MtfA [Escherichia coli]|nr:DgsA anti-repressor MtfA [Escherichia coli]
MIKWPWKVQESAHQTALPWQEALSIPLLTCLTEQEQSKLVTLAERFLQQKRLVPLQGFELDSLRSCRIALLFCLPVLELGLEWLDGFHEVLIYPAPFVVDDEWEDDIGLVHNQRIVQSGQSWQQGPIVLNWLDIQDSFDASGFNLIIHEVAHKLDTRNGDRASGVPFIPLREVAGWEHDLHAAMTTFRKKSNWLARMRRALMLMLPVILLNVLPYFLNISLAPQNFLLLVSLIVATFLPILSTRSFAETASR